MRSPFHLRLLCALSFATTVAGPSVAGTPTRNVTARARAIGTDKPQDVPARWILTNPDEARLKVPAFVLGIEKADRQVIGCPPYRGLDIARAPEVVRRQIRRTFYETPLASDCLFVSHIAEFMPTAEAGVFAPTLRYDAYREVDPPAPRDVFAKGREATLALADRLNTVAAQRAVTGRPISHLIVFATGWHTQQKTTLANMDELFGWISAAAAGDPTFSPLFVGISWPSFSDELAKKADRLGFLGYPTISKDADEVGMVAVSTLVNQVLWPVRESLPDKPRVIVIGHSFGARVASWSPFTAALLPARAGGSDGAGPDLVIGLQGAFPASRFDATAKHFWPYDEGSPFGDFAASRTAFAYTCAEDEALRNARFFDTTIGDAKTYDRARSGKVPAFSTCRVADQGAAELRLEPPLDPTARKVLLIDARSIIRQHNDVRNEQVARLIWTLMARLAPR